jgi:hypothetical protein
MAAKKKVKATPTRRVIARKATPVEKKEPDSAYFLKLVMYFVFGTFWIHIASSDWIVPLPFGFIIGMAFATHDHFQIDRKVEYAILLVAMFLSYFITPKLILNF